MTKKTAEKLQAELKELTIGQRKSLRVLREAGGKLNIDNLPHPNNKRSMVSLVEMKLATWKAKAQQWVLTAKGAKLAALAG